LLEGLGKISINDTSELNLRVNSRQLFRLFEKLVKPQQSKKKQHGTEIGTGNPLISYLGRLLTAIEIPDQWVGWLPFAISRGYRMYRPDIVIASLPVNSAAIAAVEIARWHKCPVVLDFRDPWNRLDELIECRSLRKTLQIAVERYCVNESSLLIATTRGVATHLECIHKLNCAPQIIYNSSARLENVGESAEQLERTTLLYAGNVYGPRTLAPLMHALQIGDREGRLSPEGFQIKYIGATGACVKKTAKQYGVEKYLTLVDRMPQREIIRESRRATALLTIVGRGHEGQVPAKLFEQLEIRRPLLLVAPESAEAADIIRKYGWGITHLPEDVGGIANRLVQISKKDLGGWGRPGETPLEFTEEGSMAMLDHLLRSVINKKLSLTSVI
jgi:hypothetical protein